MIEIYELDLARKIEKYCDRSRFDLETFVSLVGKKDISNYERIDYEAFFSHIKGMTESLILIELYHENFEEKFKDAERHLRVYLREAKEILIDRLTEKEKEIIRGKNERRKTKR